MATSERWRAGRKTRRTLWRDEQLVGMVDSPEIAAEIVETMNRVGRLVAEVRAESGRERSLPLLPDMTIVDKDCTCGPYGGCDG